MYTYVICAYLYVPVHVFGFPIFCLYHHRKSEWNRRVTETSLNIFKGRPWKSSIIILQKNHCVSWLLFIAPRQNIAYHPPEPNIDPAK